MYSGTHFTGRLGAAQCSRTLAAGKRLSFPFTLSKSIAKPKSQSQSQSEPQPKPESITERFVRTGLEFHSRLLQHGDHNL